MTRVDRLELVRVELMPERPGPGKLYYSEKYGSLIHLCACGCGRKSVTPPRTHWRDGWDFDESGPTLSPSILNKVCGAHYFLRAGAIVWA